MIRIFLTMTGSIITVAIAAPIPKELRTAPLEGTWKIVSLCCNGQPTASASSGRSTIDDQMLSLQDARKPPAANSNIQFVYDPKTYAMGYSYCDRNFTGIYTIHGDPRRYTRAVFQFERPRAPDLLRSGVTP